MNSPLKSCRRPKSQVPFPATRASLPRPLYLPLEQARQLTAPRAAVLGAITFGSGIAAVLDGVVPSLSIQLDPFHTPLAEVWLAEGAVEMNERNGIQYGSDGNVLFGIVSRRASPGNCLATVTYEAYRDVLTLIRDIGFANLLKIWHHFPGINEDLHGLEQYRHFCIGRHRAFLEYAGHLLPSNLPAASAVGTPRGDALAMYFISARTAAMPIENPRQVSAYRYPVQYGPKSPSFARAVLQTTETEARIYISGTASIVGYESLHHYDVRAQLDEILRNLESLHDTIQRNSQLPVKPLPELMFKVYIRRPTDYPIVKEAFEQRLGSTPSALYVHADICRVELLLEIEAIGSSRS